MSKWIGPGEFFFQKKGEGKKEDDVAVFSFNLFCVHFSLLFESHRLFCPRGEKLGSKYLSLTEIETQRCRRKGARSP